MKPYKYSSKVPSQCPCCINVPRKHVKTVRNRDYRRKTKQALRGLTR